jgi:hypothetical protein
LRPDFVLGFEMRGQNAIKSSFGPVKHSIAKVIELNANMILVFKYFELGIGIVIRIPG